MGTPSITFNKRTLEQDFAFLARVVTNAGADIIKTNLSCPNLYSSLSTYKNPIAVFAIACAIYEKISNIPHNS